MRETITFIVLVLAWPLGAFVLMQGLSLLTGAAFGDPPRDEHPAFLPPEERDSAGSA